jgi:hypothetical protein
MPGVSSTGNSGDRFPVFNDHMKSFEQVISGTDSLSLKAFTSFAEQREPETVMSEPRAHEIRCLDQTCEQFRRIVVVVENKTETVEEERALTVFPLLFSLGHILLHGVEISVCLN